VDLSNFALYPSLKDKAVFITGGGSGIGAAITECFLAQGSRVAFVDIDEDPSRKLCAELKMQYGREPAFLKCDIRDIAALRRAVAEAASEVGLFNVLVNNAANDMRHDWREVEPDYWDDRMAINLRPLFFTIQAIAPMMQKLGGGSIINFGSISWKIASGNLPAYVTAKAAIHGLTRGMARDLGQTSIRVNTVLPGWVMTERQLKLWLDAEGQARIGRSQCLKGRIMPVDLARMVLFLASDDARMCSAQEFTVDGGWA
jgi:NAD(P)-dependent dehydrogenase (short-subunit alcohol dehydrogenase family)